MLKFFCLSEEETKKYFGKSPEKRKVLKAKYNKHIFNNAPSEKGLAYWLRDMPDEWGCRPAACYITENGDIYDNSISVFLWCTSCYVG